MTKKDVQEMRCIAGVAVGTTGMSGKEKLKLVVAFAMVLHKLPATFGLISFLIACRWPLPRLAIAVFAESRSLFQKAGLGEGFVIGSCREQDSCACQWDRASLQSNCQ